MKRFIFLLLLIPLMYFPCYISNELLIELTKEDGLYEYAGAFLFLLTAISFFFLAMKPNFYKTNKKSGKMPGRIYFWLFAFLFLFAFGEEISWGQRIFNFETPQAIKEINMQQEFNFHNLKFFHGKNEAGEEKTGFIALFTMHRLFYLSFFIYLLVIPVLYTKNAKIRAFINCIKLPVPNITIGLLFMFNLLYGNVLRDLILDVDNHGIVEIKEFLMGFILLNLPLLWINFSKIRKGVQD